MEGQSLAKGLTAGSGAELAIRAGQRSQSLSQRMLSLKAKSEITSAFKELAAS